MTKQKTACIFGTWLFEEIYSLQFQDIDNDGRVWVDLKNEKMNLYREDSERFTIEELYDKFLTVTNIIQ